MTQNDPKWQKWQKWPKMAQNGPKWPKLAVIEQNRPKLVQRVKIWVTKGRRVPPKYRQKCQKMPKCQKTEFEEKR
jgi:hypothetical protein